MVHGSLWKNGVGQAHVLALVPVMSNVTLKVGVLGSFLRGAGYRYRITGSLKGIKYQVSRIKTKDELP